jgi:phospholipid/cholesterol/gamma-HCH transport system substrate-binding protein
MASLNTLLADPAIAQSLHNVQTITSNLTTTTAEANRLVAQLNNQVPGMMSKANGVLDNTTTLTATLNEKVSSVDVAATMAKIDQTLANVNQITEQMSSREGSLGLLMNDPSLYNNLNATMLSADSLLVNLRQHPKRYVHFSVFGKKDK